MASLKNYKLKVQNVLPPNQINIKLAILLANQIKSNQFKLTESSSTFQLI